MGPYIMGLPTQYAHQFCFRCDSKNHVEVMLSRPRPVRRH